MIIATSSNKPTLVLVLDNIRSAHNVGAILRSAACFDVELVIAAGITPYTHIHNDTRLPHIAHRIHRRITKSSLGAEEFVRMKWSSSTKVCVDELLGAGFDVAAVEQSADATPLQRFIPSLNQALVFGNEVHGITNLEDYETTITIPHATAKESLNVSVATGIVLYALRNQN